MTSRGLVPLALFTLIALVLGPAAVRAQRASLAVGAAAPAGDLANSAATGYDIDFQARTEPLIGPLALRIDISLDHLAGKGGYANYQISAESLSLVGDLGPALYWMAGPGYYQSNAKTEILGHNANVQQSYFGVQAALGVNVPVFRWDGFLEAAAVRLFTPGQSLVYVPLRFGIRL